MSTRNKYTCFPEVVVVIKLSESYTEVVVIT